jgi:hypothetical protein
VEDLEEEIIEEVEDRLVSKLDSFEMPHRRFNKSPLSFQLLEKGVKLPETMPYLHEQDCYHEQSH